MTSTSLLAPKVVFGFVQTWGTPNIHMEKNMEKNHDILVIFRPEERFREDSSRLCSTGARNGTMDVMAMGSTTWNITHQLDTFGYLQLWGTSPNCHFTGVEWWSHIRSNNERSRVNVHLGFGHPEANIESSMGEDKREESRLVWNMSAFSCLQNRLVGTKGRVTTHLCAKLSTGQTSSDQLDWGQYVVYTRKQVPCQLMLQPKLCWFEVFLGESLRNKIEQM